MVTGLCKDLIAIYLQHVVELSILPVYAENV